MNQQDEIQKQSMSVRVENDPAKKKDFGSIPVPKSTHQKAQSPIKSVKSEKKDVNAEEVFKV